MSTQTNAMTWIGWSISALCIIFLIVDFGMKIVKARASMEGTVKLGWPAEHVQTIGFICMLFTILYAIPQTALIGAIALSTYLGGATAIMMRSKTPYVFPIVFGIMLWVGLYFRDEEVRSIF